MKYKSCHTFGYQENKACASNDFCGVLLRSLLLLFTASFVACGGSSQQDTTYASSNAASTGAAGESSPSGVSNRANDPRVSKSRGTEGGVVVLWPRVRPETEVQSAAAQSVQDALVQIAKEVAPDAALDVRPSPERVCPQGGCQGVALGAVLISQGPTCAVVGLLSSSGESDTELFPWHSAMQLKRSRVPFRSPPESEVIVEDYGSCDDLGTKLLANAKDIKAALQTMVE